MIIAHLFRCSGTGHSIETLFGSLQQAIKQPENGFVNAFRLPFVSRSLGSIWRNLRFVTTIKADVFHITGDVHYAALLLPSSRTVLTIHDCVLLKTNRNRPVRYAFFWLFWYYLPIRRAAIVTVVSEKTRRELIQSVGPLGKKAIVIPNGYDPVFTYQPAVTRKRPPVLLQIGTAPHKNIPRLLAAINGIDCKLILVGPLSEVLIKDLQQRRIKYCNYVDLSRNTLLQLYVNCDLVTFISTYEGFGMPILEANAIGRPVITSNCSPLREVANGAAHVVDPADVTAIRQGILRLIYDPTYRQLLVDAGLKNVQSYTASVIADQYVRCYQQLYPHHSLSASVP